MRVDRAERKMCVAKRCSGMRRVVADIVEYGGAMLRAVDV
jgi:hypothetical protein